MYFLRIATTCAKAILRDFVYFQFRTYSDSLKSIFHIHIKLSGAKKLMKMTDLLPSLDNYKETLISPDSIKSEFKEYFVN